LGFPSFFEMILCFQAKYRPNFAAATGQKAAGSVQ
jgi:hypothetical protein